MEANKLPNAQAFEMTANTALEGGTFLCIIYTATTTFTEATSVLSHLYIKTSPEIPDFDPVREQKMPKVFYREDYRQTFTRVAKNVISIYGAPCFQHNRRKLKQCTAFTATVATDQNVKYFAYTYLYVHYLTPTMPIFKITYVRREIWM